MPLYEFILSIYEKSQVFIVLHGNNCRWVSSKEIHLNDLKYWKRNASLFVCDIQMCFPPTLLNSQENYLIHLVEEIKQCGLIHIQTFWFVERYMKALKQFVSEKPRIEGYIIEGYIIFREMVQVLT